MKSLIGSFFSFYNNLKNGFWMPIAAGLAFCIGVPPFNSFLHPAFTFFPLLSFVAVLPLFLFAMHASVKRSVIYCYLFGLAASAGQFYWIAFVVPEGLWPLVLFSVFLLTLIEGLFYLAVGLGFRFSRKKFPRAYPLIFPSIWVLCEYLRSLGEMSFPWNLIGYSLAPVLPLSQAASITGVYGLSFLVVLGNVLAWKFLGTYYRTGKKAIGLPVFIVVCAAMSVWGFARMHRPLQTENGNSVKISVLQGSIDQNHWGNNSLDTSFAIFDTLLAKAIVDKPDIIIMPESALLCYLLRQRSIRDRVVAWSRKFRIPMILGALHWDAVAAPRQRSTTPYFVYNAAFFLDTASEKFQQYFKINLVPFSEVLPFQGIFPILSRVNLGQADFKAGNNPVVYSIGASVKAAPFICYEIIYPSFVRDRVKRGANLLVNITNDGWFGRSSGAFQHATMARLRCIENGVSLARSANSGISMFVDQYGRVLGRTRLYDRTSLAKTISVARIPTMYSRIGDWPVLFSCLVLAISLGWLAYGTKARSSNG
jgi:apolipoprotein N-acyltransferase